MNLIYVGKSQEFIVPHVGRCFENALRFHEMCAKMENLGFRCYDIADPMLRDYDKSFWQVDLFFCRNNEKIFEYAYYK